MRKAIFTALIALFPGTVAANCVPPMTVMFSCQILNSAKVVEICQNLPPDQAVPDRYSYNFGDPLQPAELYFEDDGIRMAAQYFDGEVDNALNTLGMGVQNGNHIYAFYLTGIFDSRIRAAQLHVFDSVKTFDSGKTDQEALRLYCDPETVRVDWRFIGP